ncbi:MAG TPA: hypothetical protein VHB74_13505 [Devosia sp.]|nr:hypothetical protein [Devosia sp.]
MTTARKSTEQGAAAGPLALRPIDRMHLARQALGDPGIELEILRMFESLISSHFADLRETGSTSERLHHLHTLKAASVGVGAWSLAEHAYIIESEIRAGEPFSSERVDDLAFCVEEVRGFIAGLVGEEGDGLGQPFGIA